MSFQAVLFDLDGTLLDTLEDLGNSMNAVLASMGFPPHPIESYKIFVGEGVRLLAQRALPAQCTDDATIATCLAGMREEYGRRWAERTKPYDGIVDLLDELEKRGIKRAVLSNKNDDMTRKVVQHLLPGITFDAVMGLREGKPKKPDPASALEISRFLKVDPAAFIYLGDTSTDMQTAIGAGMYPVGALWGFRTGEELKAYGAKAIIGHPSELLKIF